MSLDTYPGTSCQCCLLACCMPSRSYRPSNRCVTVVQSGDIDANGGTSKQSTVMFGGKPDVSRMSIWSVKCALLLLPLSPNPCKTA